MEKQCKASVQKCLLSLRKGVKMEKMQHHVIAETE